MDLISAHSEPLQSMFSRCFALTCLTWFELSMVQDFKFLTFWNIGCHPHCIIFLMISDISEHSLCSDQNKKNGNGRHDLGNYYRGCFSRHV